MPSRLFSRQRQQLFRDQGGKCFWCKAPMTPTRPARRAGDPPYPPTMCTLDHVVDRLDPRRREPPKPGEKRRVAACFKCNFQRSVTAQQKFYSGMTKAERRERSGFPGV